MNLSPDEVRERLAADLGSGYEPALDVSVISRRARRTRQRHVVLGGATMALLLIVGVGLGTNALGGLTTDGTRQDPAGEVVSPSPGPADIHTDTKNFPPKKFIAAGRLAVGATVVEYDGGSPMRRDWSLYNPKTGEYEETKWSWVDVAPGLGKAAVLDGQLPTSKLHIIDMVTGDIDDTIVLESPVGSLSWSPDGTKILATAYSADPDVHLPSSDPAAAGASSRTGFFIIDSTDSANERSFVALPPPAAGEEADGEVQPARQDFGWSLDGSMVWSEPGTPDGIDRLVYDLKGNPANGEPNKYLPASEHSANSPDGKLAIAGGGETSVVVDLSTGQRVGKHDVINFIAWADNDHLIALACVTSCDAGGEVALMLVSADGKERTQLSAAYGADPISHGIGYMLTRR